MGFQLSSHCRANQSSQQQQAKNRIGENVVFPSIQHFYGPKVGLLLGLIPQSAVSENLRARHVQKRS